MNSVLRFLTQLAELEVAPAAVPASPRPANAHIHLPPNFSAFSTPGEAIRAAIAENLVLLGASNYYDFTVYEAFTAAALPAGIFPLYGTEILALDPGLKSRGIRVNDPSNPGRIYLCGKGLTRFQRLSATAETILGTIRRGDAERMAAMAARLDAHFTAHGIGGPLSAATVADAVAIRTGSPLETVHLQERHLALAFQERFFQQVPAHDRPARLAALLGIPAPQGDLTAAAVQNLLRAHLMKAGKPCYAAERFVNFDEARRLILEMGGIVCYPVVADGANPVCEFESTPERLIEELRARSIPMAEFIPNRNSAALLLDAVPKLRAAGIAVSAGTEHNTHDRLPLVPRCKGGEPVPASVAEIFWEGACVIAAHQFLGARGECGLTDLRGELNPAWSTADTRITELARLGAAVIDHFTRHGKVAQ